MNGRDSGVSEIVGTILLTALAVIFASGFVILLFTAPPPTSDAQPAIQAYVLPTAGNQLVLEHHGGPSVPLSQLSAIITVNGTATPYVIGTSPSWSVVSASGVAKGPTDRFAAGDRATFTSSALYGAQASALLTDTGANALVLSPAQLRGQPAPANITSAQTLTNDTIRVSFGKALLTIAAGDFRINGVAPLAARVVGDGTSADLTAAAPFATSATPTVSTTGTIAGTTDTSGLAFGTFASRVANDTLAPEITAGPTVTDPDTTLANFTWTTPEASTSNVDYGPTTALGITASVNTLVTPHALTITQLTPGTLYYYRIRSADALGNANTTAIASFVTDPVTAGGTTFDPTAPHSWTAVQTFGAGDLKVVDITKGANTYQLPTSADTLAGIGNVQTYSALQTFGAGATISSGRALLLAPTATGSLPADAAGSLVYDSTLGKLRVGSGSGFGNVTTSGNITNVDIASGAAIDDSKLANITTAGKVNDSALSSNIMLLNATQTVTGAKTYGAGTLKVTDITKGANTYQLPTNADTLAGLNNVQTYGALQTFGAGATISSGQALLLAPTATGSLPSASAGKLVYDTTLGALRVGTGASYGTLVTSGNIVNADVASGAAIAYSKLNLASSVVTGDITDGTILNADINAAAGIVDTKLATISTAGKVSDSALSSNVDLLGGTLTVTGAHTFNAGALVLNPTATGSLGATTAGKLVYDATTNQLKVGTGAAFVSYASLGTAQTWTALQTFGTNAALDGSDITSGTVGAGFLPTAAAGVAGIIPTTGVTSAMITDGTILNADINAAAGIVDTKLATISSAGKVSDSALSSNVALLAGSQTFAGAKTFGAGATISSGQGLTLTPTATGSLPTAAQGLLVYDSTVNGLKIGTGAGTYATPAVLGTAQTWTALQTFGTNAALDGSDITSGTVAAARLPTAAAATAGILPSTGLTDAMVSSSAAISYSKLNLANSIVAADLTTGVVTSAKILDGTIANADIGTGAVTSTGILDGTIANADVSASAAIAYSKLNLATSITNADIASGAAIAYSKLNLAGSIVAGDLATGSVTSSAILDGTIAAADIGTGAVTSTGILDGTIANVDIANSAVSPAKTDFVRLTGLVSLTYTSIAKNSDQCQTATLTGALVGDKLLASVNDTAMPAGSSLKGAHVSAANQVQVCITNANQAATGGFTIWVSFLDLI